MTWFESYMSNENENKNVNLFITDGTEFIEWDNKNVKICFTG